MSAPLDRLTILETLVRIADRGSISAAAEDLGISQASASRRLAELEAKLGASLVIRTTHHLALTSDGETLLDDARDLLTRWDQLTDTLQIKGERLQGSLHVVAPIALGQTHLAKAAAAFLRSHPDIQLRWRLSDEPIDATKSGIDLWISAGRVQDDRLIARQLAVADRLIICAPSLHKDQPLKHPRALSALPFIAISPFEGAQFKLSHRTRPTIAVKAKARMSTTDIRAGLTAASAGAGYMIAPRWLAADALRHGDLVDLIPDWRPPPLTINAAYPVNRRGLMRLERLVSALAESLEATLKP